MAAAEAVAVTTTVGAVAAASVRRLLTKRSQLRFSDKGGLFQVTLVHFPPRYGVGLKPSPKTAETREIKRFFWPAFLPFQRLNSRLSLGDLTMLQITAVVLAATALVAGTPSTPTTASDCLAFGPSTSLAVESEHSAQSADVPTVDKAKVRYGRVSEIDFEKHKIGVVNSKKVYLEIPAYKTIVKDKVERGSARYIKLMEEATSSFRSALAKVAEKKSLKLIVETGGVSGVKTSEVTDAIIGAL